MTELYEGLHLKAVISKKNLLSNQYGKVKLISLSPKLPIRGTAETLYQLAKYQEHR